MGRMQEVPPWGFLSPALAVELESRRAMRQAKAAEARARGQSLAPKIKTYIMRFGRGGQPARPTRPAKPVKPEKPTWLTGPARPARPKKPAMPAWPAKLSKTTRKAPRTRGKVKATTKIKAIIVIPFVTRS